MTRPRPESQGRLPTMYRMQTPFTIRHDVEQPSQRPERKKPMVPQLHRHLS
jgi:hypothetical protein